MKRQDGPRIKDGDTIKFRWIGIQTCIEHSGGFEHQHARNNVVAPGVSVTASDVVDDACW